jgi:two-component system, cell cycle sensor histidine kinase and response regulator CckA
MDEEPIRLLLVEDDAADASLIGRTLSEASHPAFEVEQVPTMGECLQRLRHNGFDAVLLDLVLPDSQGLATLTTVLAVAGGTPVLVLADPAEEPLARGSLEAGAQDYLVKGQIFGSMLGRAVCRNLERERSDRVAWRSEEHLRRLGARARFETSLLEAVGEAVIATDQDGTILYWNAAAERIYGWDATEVLGEKVFDVTLPNLAAERAVEIMALVTRGEIWSGEFSVPRRDGTVFPALVTIAPIRNEAGERLGVVVATSDLTEVKRLEQQLQQAQRMEAVGRLAGGITHDFNNILTGIQGSTYFLLEGLSPSDPLRADAEQIRKSAERAAALTRQLLALSRKQVLQPRVFDLGAVVAGMEKMLARVIGEDVELVFSCDPQLGRVEADPGQIEQVVLNLAVNARDAMPDGGKLEIELRNVEVCGQRATGEPASGSWVLLRVRDTGTGIAADVLPHIFEPFFTTKAVGQGTGLGLSTVYGIITQSGGRIEVESQPGAGTTVEVCLPRADAAMEAPVPPLPRAEVSGRQTILLVEDEDAVRLLIVRVLRRVGYHVLSARNGAEALLISSRHTQPIDLLLTDVVMPQMSGRELAEHLIEMRPGLRVLYISGYTSEITGRHGLLEGGQSFLEKPFSPAQLAERVHDVLSAPVAVREKAPR